MTIWAIGDLHLPGGADKPMDVFGSHWAGHFDKIRQSWHALVGPEDVVLIPGDISWAMRLSDAKPDLEAIGALPGHKVILRGNHDYWWSSLAQVRAALPQGMYALQNDTLRFDDTIICGARGWLCPGAPAFTQEDERIYQRELARLELSLCAAAQQEDILRRQSIVPRTIAMLHFPPFLDKSQPTAVTALLTRYNIPQAVYGHLHGNTLTGGPTARLEQTQYYLVSCDALNFQLYQIPNPNGQQNH